MAVTFVAAGAEATGTGAVTVGLPAGLQTDDLLLLVVETANEAVVLGTGASGWVQLTSSPQGTGTAAGAAATRLTVYYRWVDGTQVNVGINDAGDHIDAGIVAYRGVDRTNPFDVQSGGVKATASTTVTFNSVTTTVANTRVLLIEAHSLPDTNTNDQTSAWTNANLTGITARLNYNTASGNGGGVSVADGLDATAGATGTSTATIGASAVNGFITLALRPAPENQTLTPSRYDNSNTFYGPTVAAGTVTLTPALYTNDNTFYEPTATASVTLSASLYSDDDTFYEATVQAAAPSQTLTPDLYSNTNDFFAATVTAGEVTLTPALYTNSNTLYEPTVTPGAVALTPARYDNANTLYAPTVTAGAVDLTPARYDNSQTFYTVTVDVGPVTLTPARYDNTNDFFAPVVSVGGATLAPNRYDNTQSFYAPTVTPGAVTLSPGLYSNSQSFYAADIPPPIRALIQRNFNRSNRVPNSTMQGAVVGVIGSGGALPTTWSMGSFAGITRQVVATGTLPDGNPYIDIRVSGTNSTGVTQYPDLYIPAYNNALAPVANAGMQVSAGLYIDLIAGSKSGFSNSTGTAIAVGGFYVTANSSIYIEATSSANVTYGTRITVSRTLTDARSNRAVVFVSLAVPNGNTVDVTLRFSQPQVEYGPVTAYIPTSGTAVEVATVNTFYAPSVAQALSASRFDNSQTFYAPTVTSGAVTLTPALFTNSNTFYSPTQTNVRTLTASLFTNSNTFYDATQTNVRTLTPALYSNSQTFYAAAVAFDELTLAPPLYTNANDFYSPTVASETVLPPLFTNSSTFYSPQINHALFAHGYVQPGYVQPGYVEFPYFNAPTFYAATVTPGEVALTPSRYNNAQAFYSPLVIPEFYKITAAQAKLLYDIYLLHGLESPLVVGPTSRTAGVVEQSVSESNGVVTITTTSDSILAGVAPGLMIEELAALHGLTDPLEVSATTRTAGTITQVFGTSGNATTVTRQ